MLGPDEHSREDQAAFKPLDECWAHCHTGCFPVLPVGSNGGAIEKDEVVDVEARFKQGKCCPVNGMRVLTERYSDREQRVHNEIAK